MTGDPSVSGQGESPVQGAAANPFSVLSTQQASFNTAGNVPPLKNDDSRAGVLSRSFLQNRLRRLRTLPFLSPSRSSRSVQQAADSIGPLGLNLLHEPSDPRIDFVFIHGLGGGSRKTWSFSSEPGMFWPQEWLPNEVGFKHVRLHSYGYNSDPSTRKKSPLTVHEFGQGFLADLYSSPYLRKNGDNPIVLVAHSMGGLVIKKAYLLATRDPTYQTIARRIHTMYFLGTPHRGADSAHLVKLIRQSVGYGPKAFLDDLTPGSRSLQQINDEFRHVCSDIHLWSFTEGLPTSFGVTSSLVVEDQSAVLGLPNEHVRYIEADHRHICKFDSPVNPNYIVLQRDFQTTIEQIGNEISLQRRDEYKSQMKKVGSLLRTWQRPDATLLATNEKQHPGTCEWLTESNTFQEWIHNPANYGEDVYLRRTSSEARPPNILWLNGRPGTGKTVAAGHVIRYLESCNLDCSFYFFERKDKANATVAAFLRSIAFQMAESSFEVRRAIVSMAEDDVRVSHDDHHMLWTSLFVERIFKVELTEPQCWVIDAVDECSTKGFAALVSMLSSLEGKNPVRIFMTSLPGGQLGRLFTLERTEFSEITAGQEGSLTDIELLAKARCPPDNDVGSYPDLVSDIRARSNGIFLWASLTVAKLEDVYSVEDKQEVLRQIPLEMDVLFSRIVGSIAESPSAELAKCILKWTICAPKSLHVRELADAVRLDIGRTLTASSRQLETLTGHLVFVDNHSLVHITHQTMLTFLTQERDTFWIDRAMAHSQIAEVCLKVLCSAEFCPPRARRGATTTGDTALLPLSHYATHNFSYHLVHGSSTTTAPLILLTKFLKSNVLAWIEKMANSGDLWNLQFTAQRLKSYLGRRAKYEPSVSVEIQTVSAWAADIYHVAAAFHSSLLTSPSSIYTLIPYFSPPNSIIRQLFAKPTKRLKITGQLEEGWSDRLACYLFPEEATALASSVRLLAVGLANGDVRIYHIAGSGNFDYAGMLTHGKKVRHLAFNQSSSLLASCSVRKLMLWDVRASRGSLFPCLWSQCIDFTSSCMSFHPRESALVLADQHHSTIVTFEIADGQRKESTFLHVSSDSDSSDNSAQKLSSWTPSQQIRFDPNYKLAALAYRNASVSIWDLDLVEEIGIFEKEGFENVYATPQTLNMIFNPIAELELLAITYKDGDIVTCNPWALEQESKYHLQASLVSLAATTDGRVLAGATEDGGIYLFQFDTLQPLYQISRADDRLRVHNILFSADNLRLFDIRGQCWNVWEPFVLAQKDGLDDSSSESHSEAIALSEPPASQPLAFQWGEAITAIEPSAHDSFLLVGRQDGTIEICESDTGDAIDKFQLHDAFTEIEFIYWNDKKSLMLSVDITGRCIVTQFSSIRKGTKVQSNCLLDHREWSSIRQALIDSKTESILICTDSSVKLIGVDGSLLVELKDLPGSWWTRHPSNDDHLIAIHDNKLHLFEWRFLKRLFHADEAAVLMPEPPMRTESHPWICGANSSYLAQSVIQLRGRSSHLVALDMSNITTETNKVPLQVLNHDSLNIQLLLGCLRSRLFFLDTSGWVCSITLKNLNAATHYARHFFIPPTWRTGVDVIKIISKTAVAFGRGEWLIIFHGFLELEEKVTL